MAEADANARKGQRKVELTLEQSFRENLEGVVQLAREFEKELGKERMLAIAERMNVGASVAYLRKKLDNVPHESLEDYVSYHEKVMRSNIADGTQSGENLEIGPKRFVYVIRECMWAKTFRELGAADLGYALNCSSDFAYARCFNPKLKLTRTKTLMQGDDCCEFVYTWEG